MESPMPEALRPRAEVRCSRWLAAARWDDGLLVPGRSRRAAADLRLRPQGIELAAGSASALVPWDVGRWHVDALAKSRNGGPVGIALVVSDDAAELTRPVHRARRNALWRRLDGDDPVIPLHAPRLWSGPRVDDDRSGVYVLLEQIVERPACRRRLASAEAVTRLLDDIRTRPHHMVRRPEGVRRRTFEIMNALRMAGYEHPVGGRPLPGDVVPDADHVTDVVMGRLRANRYVADLAIERDEVRELVARHHCDIEPWPFEALLL